MKKISLLGSTGSIGTQTLDIVDSSQGSLQVYCLTAATKIDLMEEQVRKYSPKIAAMMDDKSAQELRQRVRDTSTSVLAGMEGLIAAVTAEEIDTVVTAVSGRIGVEPTLEALKNKKYIALANKETLVAAGELVMNTAQQSGSSIIPVDSEHSAVFQCLSQSPKEVDKIILTASGGPFLGLSKQELAEVTPDKALKHPNWEMGAKITIDSATMMNKGLEVIEAHFLFNIPYDKIEVLIHPQSIVHSMVEYVDGSVLAQLGEPDMRLPIQYALSYPERWQHKYTGLNLRGKNLTFIDPDLKKFPFLELAYYCGRKGGTLPAVMNAANEICVHAFLSGSIKYFEMFNLVEKVSLEHKIVSADCLENILAADKWARDRAETLIHSKY